MTTSGEGEEGKKAETRCMIILSEKKEDNNISSFRESEWPFSFLVSLVFVSFAWI